MFWFSQSNAFSLIINTQSFKHNNILNPTIKCFMLDYKYTEPLTKISIFQIKEQIKEFKGITFPGYIQMYTGVHSDDVHLDLSRESYFFELFDLSLDVPLAREISQGYMAYVSLWIPLIWGVKVLHVMVVTWPWGICLICMLEARGLQARGLRAYISSKSRMAMLQVLCITLLP